MARVLTSIMLLMGLCCLCVMPLIAQDTDAGYQEALRRIEEARITGATELNLSQLGLETLPPEIGELISLQWLFLYNNQLTLLPPEIGNLTSLRGFSLMQNRLTSLPLEIGQLTNLQYLYVTGNRLTSLPPEIGWLTGLQEFDITDNAPFTFPPRWIQEQGSGAVMSYLRDYDAIIIQQRQQIILCIAVGIGGLAVLVLAFRWRQRRGLSEKKKRA